MNRQQGSELKRLKAWKAELEGELPVLKQQMQSASAAYNQSQNKVNKLSSQIEALENVKKLCISDHAMLRYIERVMGIDLSDICDDILDQLDNMYENLGDGKYPIEGGRAVIQNGTVVTIEGSL